MAPIAAATMKNQSNNQTLTILNQSTGHSVSQRSREEEDEE
jgi:hypothetical protein